MRRPLFVAGMAALVSLFFCMFLPESALALVPGAVFLFSAALLLTRKRTYASYAVTVAAVCAVFILLFEGHLLLRVNPTRTLTGRTAAVEGRLKAFPEQTENSVCFTLQNCTVNGNATHLSVRVYTAVPLEASPGDTVCFPAVKFFEEAQNGFDYNTLSTGAWLSAYAKQGLVTAVYTGHAPLVVIEKLRHAVNAFFENALPDLHAGIAAALFTGESRRLQTDFREKLRTAGASHIFAVSGMHLSLWAGLFFLLFRRRAKTKAWANTAVAVFVLFYMFFTGCSPSVVRAGSMLLCVCFGRMLRRYADGLNTLGGAAILQLAKNPFLAGNISFLLSFSATAAIFILYPYLRISVPDGQDTGTRLCRKSAGIPNVLLLSLCVLFFTVPISSVFFSAVSLLSPVSSLLCTLPAEGVMLTAALSLAFSFVSPVSGFFLRLCGVCCGVIDRLVDGLSAFDFALCPVRETTVVFWYAGTVCVCAAVYFLSRKNARAAVSVLLVSSTLVLLCGSMKTLADRDKTTLLLPPAGNAVSTALVFDGSTAVLIGTGETYEGAAETARFLTENGVTSVKTLIVPTAERAAAGQLRFFSQRFRFENVFAAEECRKFFTSVQTYRCAETFTVTFQNGVQYENVRTPAYTAGRITVGGHRVLMSFSPSDDFSAAPETLKDADVLICRAGIPRGLDPASFPLIYVQTDKTSAALRLPSNAHTVAEENGVFLSLSG